MSTAPSLPSAAAPASRLTPAQLAETVRRWAVEPDLWRPLARFTEPERWYQRLAQESDHEVWLLTWLPGQGTEIHDHGGSRGAFGVVEGALAEEFFAGVAAGQPPVTHQLHPGGVRAFGPRHIHQVRNDGARPAISIHAYAPRLGTMSYYTHRPDGGLHRHRTDPVDD